MRPAIVWVGIVVGLLALCVATQTVLLVAAVNDPSFALEPDYEDKAANWDEIQKSRRESASLGWSVDLRTRRTGAREVDVELSLADRDGRPILGADVAIEAFHNARANRVFKQRLQSVGDGIYHELLPLHRPGIWEFRLEISNGSENYSGVIRKSIAAATPG